MKKIIATTTLLFLMTLSFKSQVTTEIQMKNGMVYYTFNNKLENTKKCLSTYFEPKNYGEILKKTLAKSQETSTNKSKPFFDKNYTLQVIVGHVKGKCNDTTIGGTIKIGLPVKVKPTRLYNLKKQKIISHNVEAKIEIVFLSKSEYIVKLKGFTYNTTTMNAYKSETGEHPLGEMYQDYLSDEDKSKDQTNLYKDINLMVNEADRIIRESIMEMYKVDELD